MPETNVEIVRKFLDRQTSLLHQVKEINLLISRADTSAPFLTNRSSQRVNIPSEDVVALCSKQLKQHESELALINARIEAMSLLAITPTTE